ncbi:Cysteine-rich protein 2-binding protein [Gryllus bimaculatus]|nr:Cysteine-rich protein 2-binding protein [Gryllus bimaculatus]
MAKCSYCHNSGESKEDLYVVCSSCNNSVHVACLKRSVPGGLLGDNFFNFVCESCNLEDCEQITRQKLSWFAIIVLAMYNLHRRSEGVSKRGYFHWKSHICNFIDKHWNVLFTPSVKKKKSWMGTVSGTLSHFCPSFFLSGSEELKEPGWWRITHDNMSPQQIVEIHIRNQTSKKKCKSKVQEVIAAGNSSPSSSGNEESNVSSNYLDCGASVMETEIITACTCECTLNSESVSCEHCRKGTGFKNENKNSNSVYPDLFISDEHLSDMDVDVNDVVPLDLRGSERDTFNLFENFFPCVESKETVQSRSSFTSGLPDKTYHIEDHHLVSWEDVQSENPSCSKNINIPKDKRIGKDASKVVNENLETQQVLSQSLFQRTCVPMSEYEELQLLSQLRQTSETRELPGFALRLYRKLCVRQLKRQRGLPIFNLDKTFQGNKDHKRSANVWMHPNFCSRNNTPVDARILDRFYHVPTKFDNEKQKNCPFKIRLMGCSEPTCFVSPYTQRQLKPFIRRDYETVPHWLKLLSEIKVKANEKDINWKPEPRRPIDYCYVRPQHISAVNSLCCEFFYPGIDLTETLQYPDFSCVVLYRKLVIAFAFMVPDAGYNETYISFLFTRPEWRGAGIATFMLYHLIQTCMGKDITLHVSATNPAVILYQKFGFKIEEFILDFYDKYLPADSQECKHALFLRLSR